MKPLATSLLCLTLLGIAGCGDDPPCGKDKSACTDHFPPVVGDGELRAQVTGQAGNAEFWAYGGGQVFWNTDGNSVTVRGTAPAFNQSNPKQLVLTLDLFRDVEGDPPGCFVSERVLPLCFELGTSGGGTATLEDKQTGYIYVTEGAATGTVEILGTSPSGQLLGTFEVTAFLKQSDDVVPSMWVQFADGRFGVPPL